MKRTIFSILTLLILSTISLQTTFAQVTLEGHGDGVRAVAFSPDGTILASGGSEWQNEAGTVKLWDVATRTNIATLYGHTGAVFSVSFSPDGSTLASGSGDGIVKLWDVATRTNIATLKHAVGDVASVAFSPDGKTLASASLYFSFFSKADDDGTVELWDVATRTNIATLQVIATSVSFSPDGTLLASGTLDGTVELWDVATKQNIATLQGHTYWVWSVAFSPDGTTLASGALDEEATIKLWNVATRENIATLQAPGVSVAFSPDGTLLASASDQVELWDVATKQNIATLQGHTGLVFSVAFSPDGTTLASGSEDDTVKLWDMSPDITRVPADVRGPSVTKMSNVTDGEEANLEVLNRDGIIIEFNEDIASSGLKLTYEDGTDLGWVPEVKDNKVILSPIEGKELVHETSYVVRGTVRDGVGNETNLTLTFVAVKSLGTTNNEPTFTTDSRQAFESSTPSGYTRVTLSDKGPMWGVPTKYTTDSDAGTVAYMVLGKLMGCSFTDAEADRQSKVYIKTQALGRLNDFASETVCGITSSRWPSSWNGVQITHIRFFDESSSSNINEAIYNSSTGQYELTSAPTGLKEDVNSDGIVNIQDLVLVASNLGKAGQNAADVNGDGVVNIQDLVLVAGALGNSAAAPSIHPQSLEMLTAADVKSWLSQAQHFNLTDAMAQKGILFLEQLLAVLTPKETVLLANFPNPFNPETWIPYQLAKDAEITVTIYASNGQVVRRLALGHQVAGIYQSRSRAAYWDGRNEFGEPVASGVYFYTLIAGDFTATRKMLIRK